MLKTVRLTERSGSSGRPSSSTGVPGGGEGRRPGRIRVRRRRRTARRPSAGRRAPARATRGPRASPGTRIPSRTRTGVAWGARPAGRVGPRHRRGGLPSLAKGPPGEARARRGGPRAEPPLGHRRPAGEEQDEEQREQSSSRGHPGRSCGWPSAGERGFDGAGFHGIHRPRRRPVGVGLPGSRMGVHVFRRNDRPGEAPRFGHPPRPRRQGVHLPVPPGARPVAAELPRIRKLAIPPAWTSVSSRPPPPRSSRPSARTRPAGGSTGTTRASVSGRTGRSSGSWSTSRTRCRGCAGASRATSVPAASARTR